MREFKVGDRVRSTSLNFTGTISSVSGGNATIRRDDGVTGSGDRIDGYGCGWLVTNRENGDEYGIVIIDGCRPSEERKSDMTLIESFKGLFTSEPQKSFKKAGVTNDAGDLTDEGSRVFSAWLFDKYAAEFKKDVVDRILAEQEKK